jgi:uncharacterized protein YeaO (DUF488 family)
VSCEHTFEGKTASPEQRLTAQGVSRANGAITCVRLDPLGPAVLESIDDLSVLRPIVAHMLAIAKPDLVILGTPRFERGLLKLRQKGFQHYVEKVEAAVGATRDQWPSSGKVRPPEQLRIDVYLCVMDLIRVEAQRLGIESPQIWLCKEAPAVLRALGLPTTGCCYDPPAKAPATLLKTKRWSDPAEPVDGRRLLVTRRWPRGVRKENAAWDVWLKHLGPSLTLLAEWRAKSITWIEYTKRYREEMVGQADAIAAIAQRIADGQTITLLCSRDCEDEAECHRTLLEELVEEALGRLRRALVLSAPRLATAV